LVWFGFEFEFENAAMAIVSVTSTTGNVVPFDETVTEIG
jgi:hypothetical protein